VSHCGDICYLTTLFSTAPIQPLYIALQVGCVTLTKYLCARRKRNRNEKEKGKEKEKENEKKKKKKKKMTKK
jgi:hypothetical protein